ncbi:MAG: hypothetical protein ACTMHL_14560 [Janibacter sp.]
MKFPKLPRLRHSDRPLRYVPEQGPRERALEVERQVPYPAHLSVR